MLTDSPEAVFFASEQLLNVSAMIYTCKWGLVDEWYRHDQASNLTVYDHNDHGTVGKFGLQYDDLKDMALSKGNCGLFLLESCIL